MKDEEYYLSIGIYVTTGMAAMAIACHYGEILQAALLVIPLIVGGFLDWRRKRR